MKACPGCGATAEPHVRFCGSCGFAFAGERACARCGSPLQQDSRFCGACGSAAEPLSSCPTCGSPVVPGAGFCGACGRANSVAAPPPVLAPPPPAPGRPTPPRRRRATVLPALAALLTVAVAAVAYAGYTRWPGASASRGATAGPIGIASSASTASAGATGGAGLSAVPPNLFFDPAAAVASLTSGMGTPSRMPAATLSGLFEAPSTAPPVTTFLAPPAAPDVPAQVPDATAPPGVVTVTAGDGVPADFQAWVGGAVSAAISGWDVLYHDPDFNLVADATAHPLQVFVTADAATFVLPNLPASAVVPMFTDTCFNHPADRSQCQTRVTVRFVASGWSAGQSTFVTPSQLVHEVAHVAHQRLLARVGKADQYMTNGRHWQTEAFAQFTERQLPNYGAYSTVVPALASDSYLRWGAITDASYIRSYEAAWFADEMVHLNGDDPTTLTRWIKAGSAREGPGATLVRVLAGSGDTVDINRFRSLYAQAVTDFYLPGFLPDGDGRVVGLTPDVKTGATVSNDNYSGTATGTLAPLSAKVLGVALTALPDHPPPALRVSVLGGAGLRAVLLLLRTSGDQSLASCYRAVGKASAASMASGAAACFQQFARVVGVAGDGGGSAEVKISDLKKFGNPAELTVAALVINTTASAAAGAPAGVALQVGPGGAGLDVQLTGAVTGDAHAGSDAMNNPDCRLKVDAKGRKYLSIAWKVVAQGRNYDLLMTVGRPYSGPGTYSDVPDDSLAANVAVGEFGNPDHQWISAYTSRTDPTVIVVDHDEMGGTLSSVASMYEPGSITKIASSITVAGTWQCQKPIGGP